MKVTITLEGAAARQIVFTLAKSFALLSIQSTLDKPRGTVNAPWMDYPRQSGKSLFERHRNWMKAIEAERISYKRALESFVPHLPPVPPINWRSYTNPDGKVFPVHYTGSIAYEAATKYARALRDGVAG